MMKTFQQFLTEVYDKELSTATRQPGEGGRVRTSRKKTDSEIRRVKAVGGGKTAPVQSYEIVRILVHRNQDPNVNSNQRRKEGVLRMHRKQQH